MTNRTLALAGLLLILPACARQTGPTPVPTPTPITGNVCIISGNGNDNTCNVGNVTPPTSPSPGSSPTGPFVRPDYVKITQFGETCPTGINPSGQDRSVKVGCSKALTLSPKCHQANGLPDIDCPVPDNTAPDSFTVVSGAEHIIFTAFGAANPDLVRLLTGPGALSDTFNRNARGVSPGVAVITGSYAGVAVQPGQEFILTVIQ